MTDADFMQQAIAMTQTGIAKGQTPFGAVIVLQGEVIACTHNTVWQDNDPTAHAEVNAIRTAGKKLQRIDFTNADMFSTCEPCPMCLSAIHWAKIRRIVFGATIADAAAAGFSELDVPAKTLADMGGSHLIVESGLLQDACADLFRQWKDAGGREY